MTYYMVTIEKNKVEITHCFERAQDAMEWLETGFLASLDDPDNAGTVYRIEEKP